MACDPPAQDTELHAIPSVEYVALRRFSGIRRASAAAYHNGTMRTILLIVLIVAFFQLAAVCWLTADRDELYRKVNQAQILR